MMAVVPQGSGVPPSILVVDDEPVVIEVLKGVLDADRYHLVFAEDGTKALNCCSGRRFDLLIADKNLPDIQGLELVRRMKGADPGLATLVMTAYASIESVEEAMELGVDAFLPKPFAIHDLQERVDVCLHHRRVRTRAPAGRPVPAGSKRVGLLATAPGTTEILAGGTRMAGYWPVRLETLAQLLDSFERGKLEAAICSLQLLEADAQRAERLRTVLQERTGARLVVVAPRKELPVALGAIGRGARRVLYEPLESDEQVARSLDGFC